MAKEENENQIFRADGRNKFVEVLNSMFDKGKVIIALREYDLNRAKGDKFTQKIDIFMDFPKFLALADDIISGRMTQEIEEAAAKRMMVIMDIGGTSARSLSNRGCARADGLSLSRQLKMTKGNKTPYLIVAETGPGKEDAKGLIVPQYGGKDHKPEQQILIPLTDETMRSLMLITKTHIEQFIGSQYVIGAFEAKKAERAATKQQAS
jgi:hypothetical protein